ncbi:TPA: hypothetical protein ACHVKA_001931 [Yersinia enterocolitica]
MKIINRMFTTVMIVLLMNVQSINAAKNTLLTSPNHIPQIIQKIVHTHGDDSTTLPKFEVDSFEYNYHLTNKKGYVYFTLSSPEFISYYIYLINDNSLIYHEASGFINHNSKNIVLNLENINPDNYDLVVEVYNNEKVSAKKTFPLIFK